MKNAQKLFKLWNWDFAAPKERIYSVHGKQDSCLTTQLTYGLCNNIDFQGSDFYIRTEALSDLTWVRRSFLRCLHHVTDSHCKYNVRHTGIAVSTAAHACAVAIHPWLPQSACCLGMGNGHPPTIHPRWHSLLTCDRHAVTFMILSHVVNMSACIHNHFFPW